MYPRQTDRERIVHELDGETLIYDKRTHETHCLNRMSSAVWQLCDGRTSPSQMTERLQVTFESTVDPDVVRLALRQLEKAHLVESSQADQELNVRVSRRELAHRLKLVGGLSLLLPLVTSEIAPTAAQAGSPRQGGTACTEGAQCASGICFDNKCM